MTVEDNGHLDYQIGGWTLAEYVAEECEISDEVADKLVAMFNDGKEVPFIARYRRNMTGDLEAEQVHQAFNAYKTARELKKSAANIVRKLEGVSIDNCEKEIVIAKVKQARTMAELNAFSQVSHSTPNNTCLTSTISRKAQQMDENHEDILRYQKHFEYRKPVAQVSDYEVLAIKRGEQIGILFAKIEIDKGISKKFYKFARKNFGHRFHRNHNDIFEETLMEYYKYTAKEIKNSVMHILLDRAQRKSVECFARNLRHLLLTPPLKNVPIAAIDPGYANGCKVALISESGGVLFTGKFQLNGDRIQQKQDPLAEYVKIEPSHLGVGMYQHSINEKFLRKTLDLVVRECVSYVGVDVNTASQELLE
uniref:Tex-like protein N-terminal domain-containing protein n=1 Tax=Plectus sambesii TaxID=2011161 RepID=A0A914WVA3_9BILA